MASLEVHHLRPLGEADETEVETEPAELVAVCGACHNLLHSSTQPSVQDLRYEWRPACPECDRKRAQPILWGMPDGPPPEDVVIAGCLVSERPEQWACADCGHRWRDEDEPKEDEEGYDARHVLRAIWPAPRDTMIVSNFGSDHLHLALRRHDNGLYEADFRTAQGGGVVEQICAAGTMKDLCAALERALPSVLLEEGKDEDAWR